MKRLILALFLTLVSLQGWAATTIVTETNDWTKRLSLRVGPDNYTLDNSGPQQTFVVTGLKGYDRFAVEIFNSNVNNLAAFSVQVRFTAGGVWIPIATVAADYTSPVGFLYSSGTDSTPSDTLVTLTKNTNGWFSMQNLNAVEAVRIMANSAGASSVLTIKGRASQ